MVGYGSHQLNLAGTWSDDANLCFGDLWFYQGKGKIDPVDMQQQFKIDSSRSLHKMLCWCRNTTREAPTEVDTVCLMEEIFQQECGSLMRILLAFTAAGPSDVEGCFRYYV